MTASDGATSRSTAVTSVLFAACSLLAGAAHRAELGAGVLPWAAAALLFLGAGFPVILRWTPHEPSLLKLLVFASLLSPPVTGAVFFLARLGAGASLAWPVTFATLALLQVASYRRPLRTDPLGKAAWGTLGVAVLGAGTLAWLLFAQENGIRIEPDGAIWQAGMARGFLRGGLLESPWLAGEPLPFHPGLAVLLATVAGALQVAPTLAAALLATWSLVLVTVLLYLLAAPLWREARRALLAPVLALLGWNAWPGIPHDLHFGLSTFLPGDGVATALTFLVAGWLSAAHALRHGGSPWVGLTGLCHGLALCIHPLLGVAGGAATAVAAGLLLRHREGARVLLSLSVWSLPGIYLASRFGLASAPEMESTWVVGDLQGPARAAVPLLLASAGLVGGRWLGTASDGEDPDVGAHGQGGDETGRRRILLLLGLCALLPLGMIPWAPRWAVAELGRASGLALGVLAAGGLMDFWTRGALGRGWALFLGLGLVFGGGRAAGQDLGRLLDLAQRKVRVLESGPHLMPAFRSEEEAPGDGEVSSIVVPSPRELAAVEEVRRRHLAQAYRWLREQYPLRDQNPILIRSVKVSAIGPVLPDPATLYADMPLWVDRWKAAAPSSTRWASRHGRIHAMYHDTAGFDPALFRELRHLGRPVVFLITAEDRRATRAGLELDLKRWGAQELHTVGTVTLLGWQPEPGEAAQAGEAAR